MRRFSLASIGAIALAVCHPVAALAQASEADEGADAEAAATPAKPIRKVPTRVSLHSGFTFTTGDYGRPVPTDVYFVPLSLRVQHGPWRARVATSFISIDGPASIVDIDAGDAEVPVTAAGNAMQQRSGLGDVSFQLGYRLGITRDTALTSDVRIKFPTASESERLTTGTTDVTLRTQLSQRIGKVTLRAGTRRRFAGSGGRVPCR